MPIVQAVGIATGVNDKGRKIHDAMHEALKAAQDRGVSDPGELRAIMLRARDQQLTEL